MEKITEEKMRDILTRYGNFMDGFDADGDELDIDEAFKEIDTVFKVELKE